jgi:hypothetical protein
MLNNIESVLNKISDRNPEAAEYFQMILLKLDELYSDLNIQDIDNSEERISRAADIMSRQLENTMGRFNLIPSRKKGECHRFCLVKCEGKWKTKSGFYKMIKNEVVDYWLNCKNNELTIILTSSWDQVEFDRDLKRKFEGYTIDKTAAVILLGEYDYMITYLN